VKIYFPSYELPEDRAARARREDYEQDRRLGLEEDGLPPEEDDDLR